MTSEELTVPTLERWAESGAGWRIVSLADEVAVVELCECTGEPVERLRSEDPELIEYLRRSTAGPA